MKKVFTLYTCGLVAVGLAIWQPDLKWLSPLVYVLVFPVCAVWMWRSEGRTLQDLGLSRSGKTWRQFLSRGIGLGLIFPVLILLAQALFGWVTLTPRALVYGEYPTYILVPGYIAFVLIKMFFIAGIEEFVFRGFFLQRLALGMNIIWAVLLSSALWSLGHLASMVSEGLSPFAIALGILTFIVWGTALSIGCLRTGKSLWFPFGLHYGLNISFSLLGGFVLASYHAPQWLVGTPPWMPESGVLGPLIWLLAIGVIWKITKEFLYRKKSFLDAEKR